jgi:hypothetical protein
VQLAERLVMFSHPPADDNERQSRGSQIGALQDALREGCNTLHQADKEKLLGNLFAHQSSVLGEKAASVEPVGIVDPEAVAPLADEEPAAERVELSPEQLAMLEKLKSIPFGTWFEFQKEGKPMKRAKLSWRSTVTKKFMFVDQMGVKAAVVCMHELADCMLNGSVRIASEEKRPFVDRALNAIHRMLDHAA